YMSLCDVKFFAGSKVCFCSRHEKLCQTLKGRAGMGAGNRIIRGKARSIQYSKKGLQYSLLAMALQSTSWAQTTTWLGNNNDWHDTTNWSGAALPTLASPVFVFIKSPIPARQPVISQPGAQANNVFVGSVGGSSLAIQSGGELTANSLVISNSTNNGGAPNITQEAGMVTVDGNGSKLTA